VEPGVVDGAPHNGDNNAYRREGAMSVDSAEAARVEARKIRPVLKRLWGEKKWDLESVRVALEGERLDGTLEVQEMASRYETDHYVTPEGTRVGLRVRDDACVSAYVQKANYSVSVNGPYMEGGCFQPPYGH
jgi:hypothetical protein